MERDDEKKIENSLKKKKWQKAAKEDILAKEWPA